MKKEKQARRENSGLGVGKQQAKAGDLGGNADSPTANLHRAISDMILEVDQAIQAPQSTQEKIRLLMLRQYAEDIQREAAVLTGASTKNPTSDDARKLDWCFSAIDAAIRQINDNIAQAESDSERIMMLAIRQHLTPPVDFAEVAAAPAQPTPRVAPPGVDPFPVNQDPMNVHGPRFHIRDFYEMIEKKEHEDGLASLVGLRDCIEPHPGLQVEAKALQMLVDGSNALNSLACRHAYAKESGSGFSGSEVWLVNLLDKIDESVTVKDYLWELRGVAAKLRGNPATNDLANAVDGMFEGQNVMRKLNLWLKSM